MLQVFYELTPNVYVEMQTVRYRSFEVGTAAAVAEVHTGHIPFDDPGGSFDIKGWRKVRVYETTATPTLLWSGRIRNKIVKRGDSDRASLRTGADRWWDCDAVDQNTLMGARVIRGTSANRPTETAGERLAWLLSTSFTIFVDDGHVTYPTYQMDPNDYTGQTAADVIGDCAQPGGYNFFALQTDDTGFPELFFMLPTSSDWASSISISDDLADVNNVTVFAPNYEAEMIRSDEIVASGVFMPYNGSGDNDYVYVSDSAIGDEFAYVDKTAPMANVKTSTKATVIAERHLALSATEADKITCQIHVPASLANALRPWHRVPYKSTWMPGYSAYVDCRVIDWAIKQQAFPDGGEGYIISLELSPVEEATVSCLVSVATSQDHVSTADGTSPSDTITPTADSTVLAFLLGMNSNTPSATNMTAIIGYTAVYDDAAAHKATYRIASKSVSSGTGSTAAATFTGGFGGKDVWIATQVALPGSWSLVQQKAGDTVGVSQSATFDATPTPGNLILMFCHAEVTNTGNITPGGGAGPSDGWTIAGADTAAKHTGEPDSEWVRTAVYARCVGDGDGSTYSFGAEGNSNSIWIGEWSMS